MIDLKGKTALVTGANRGIGLAVAEKLAEHGAHVVLGGRRLASVEDAAQSIVAQGGSAEATVCDVTSYVSVTEAVENTVQAFGSVDILVNNAGMIDPIACMSESDPEIWGQAIDTNVKGVYHTIRAVLPIMEKQASGTIINMSSGAANSALEGWSHYCSSKIAVRKLTECAHKEMAEKGVRVVGLSPGTVATDMMAKIKSSGINPVSKLDWSTHIPAEWVGKAVVFLCGPEGVEFAGTDFSIKTPEGRARVGLPQEGAPDA